MLSTQSLREHFDRYAAAEVSAEAFEEWLTAESWDMHRLVPVGLERFVQAVQAAFLRYSDSQISKEDLRAFLIQRRDQLHRAHEATQKLEASGSCFLEITA